MQGDLGSALADQNLPWTLLFKCPQNGIRVNLHDGQFGQSLCKPRSAPGCAVGSAFALHPQCLQAAGLFTLLRCMLSCQTYLKQHSRQSLRHKCRMEIQPTADVLQVFLAECDLKLVNFAPQNISNMMWACATLGVSPGRLLSTLTAVKPDLQHALYRAMWSGLPIIM